MRVLITSQYFWPETIGAGVWLHQLAMDLVERGHQVTMVTAFPNYPHGRILDGYRGRWFQRDQVGGVKVIRTFIYPSQAKSFGPRALSFGSFCLSAAMGLARAERPDVIYAVLPPLPLGLTAEMVGAFRGVPVVINVQDIYPDIAVSLGYLKNRAAIRLFQSLERWVYRLSRAIVVITDSFRENLLRKGAPREKIRVIPNWADPNEICPGPKINAFREQLNVNGEFLVVYSGGMGHNSCLEPVVEAAALLADQPIQFVVIGDGVQRSRLEVLASSNGLRNIRFLPFQAKEKYPQVLAASDVQLVTLGESASAYSLPSKVMKIMASGRPVLALAPVGSDLAKLVEAADCGLVISANHSQGLAENLRRLVANPEDVRRMGQQARSYFVEHFDRGNCVGQIEDVLKQAANVR